MSLEFKKKWVQNFASDIDDIFINENVYDGGFVWHVFSFDKIDKSKYLCGIDAQKRYDEIDKKDALVYLYFEGKEKPITKKYMTSKQLFKCHEVYVYAKDYSWCYIKTHECDEDLDENDETYGPYFIEKIK